MSIVILKQPRRAPDASHPRSPTAPEPGGLADMVDAPDAAAPGDALATSTFTAGLVVYAVLMLCIAVLP